MSSTTCKGNRESVEDYSAQQICMQSRVVLHGSRISKKISSSILWLPAFRRLQYTLFTFTKPVARIFAQRGGEKGVWLSPLFSPPSSLSLFFPFLPLSLSLRFPPFSPLSLFPYTFSFVRSRNPQIQLSGLRERCDSTAGSGVEPQPRLNIVHFSLKIWQVLAGASTPLTGGGKCLLEKIGGSKNIENWGKISFDGKLYKIPKNT